jgi:predicted DNA-binding transcriptional regulator AlpA
MSLRSETRSIAGLVDDAVLTIPEACELIGISVDSLQRMVKASTGPIIIHLTERRRGIRVRDLRAWLDSRAKAAASS